MRAIRENILHITKDVSHIIGTGYGSNNWWKQFVESAKHVPHEISEILDVLDGAISSEEDR